MEKEIIENKDKQFRDKLKEMRMKLAKRQVQADPKEKNPPNHAKMVIPFLMVLMVTVYLVGKTMRGHEDVSTTITNKLQITEYTRPDPPDHKGAEGISPETENKSGFLSTDILSANSREKVSKPNIPPFTSEDETEEIESDTSPPPSSGISLLVHGTRIAQNLVCSEVKARKCVPQYTFALNQQQNPHVWMEVYSDSIPYVLKHVYYHEGQKYVEVPLKIEYRRMRTWSYITLKDSAHLGSWHVEIVAEDGTVLGRAEFKVMNGS
jgi:hypothetical protein